MDTVGYSVAIRTLGLNPDVLKEVLEGVFRSSVPPEAVIIYIAKGYKIPDFRVGSERYVFTEKGMVRQRALPYKEITSPYILLLDDDVIVAPDCAEKLLKAVAEGYDCVAPDAFENHKMSLKGKVYAAVSNLVFPHRDQRYAMKVRSNGSFSYLDNPKPQPYMSQSVPGTCALWSKQALLDTRLQDELWLDTLGFAYGDDQVISYKLFSRGGRLAIHYGAKVLNANAQTYSTTYHRDPLMFYKRARAQYAVWHRSVLSTRKTPLARAKAVTTCTLKVLWLIPVHVGAAVMQRRPKAIYYLLKGTFDGIKFTKSAQYKSLPPYITK